MNELRELYQETILDHNRSPRHFGKLDCPSAQAEGHNPMCGDEITLYLKVRGNRIEEASFQGCGCAISTASASMMTEAIIGRTIPEVESLFHSFQDRVTTGADDGTDIGSLEALVGVREFPVRIKCATLAWHTLIAALKNQNQKVSTE